VADNACELYDLAHDPAERTNLADRRGDEVRSLRELLQGWEESHGRFEHEAQAVSPPPPALERAMQGDRTAAVDLAALLGTMNDDLASRAIRALAELGNDALPVRDALARAMDRTGPVRTDAGIALARLGDARGEPVAEGALASGDVPTERRAALALARLGSHAGVPQLSAWARDASATDAARDGAIEALTVLRDARGFDTWIALLDDARVAPAAARALGALGDRRAVPALLTTARTTRYALTRRASLGALASLGAPEALALTVHALAGPEALPDAFPLMAALGEPGRHLAGIAAPASGPRFTMRGPVPTGPAWLYVRVTAAGPGSVAIGGAEASVPGGESEIRLPSSGPTRSMALVVRGTVRVTGVFVVAREPP
jgi:hypothetical protein